MISLLKALVLRETPSDDVSLLDEFAAWLAVQLSDRGAQVELHAREQRGDHVQATWGSGDPAVLLLTHYDTVYPPGALESMPWQVSGNRIQGPAVFDMKASLAMALVAITALRAAGRLSGGTVTLLSTSDEEIGSHSSRQLLEDLARRHTVVLCLEPPLSDGSLKTWRKGVGAFQLTALGRATHAGVSPQTGVSAILEMAAQIPILSALADIDRGTSVNVGTIHGGTRPNVVAGRCQVQIDVRYLEAGERQRIGEAFDQLEPQLAGASLELEGEWNRPAMPRTETIAATFAWAQAIARQLGIEVAEGGTGGASDANFIAPLDIPLLDGLGAIGGEAHSPLEWIAADQLVPRCALLAALIQSALQDPPQRH